MQATQYPLTRMTQNYRLLTSLYRDNGSCRILYPPSRRIWFAKWYTLQSNVAPEYVDAMRRLERRTHLRKSILTGDVLGRLYGGAAGITMVRGQDDLSQPLDQDLVLPEHSRGFRY